MLGPIKIMTSEKTKKLLDNLKNITVKKDRFEKQEPPSTNRHWPDNGITFLPKSYDNAKRYKDKLHCHLDVFAKNRVHRCLSLNLEISRKMLADVMWTNLMSSAPLYRTQIVYLLGCQF